MSDGIRLQKYLSMAGRASRREAERMILEGRIRVNGAVVEELGGRVVPGRDVVELDGEVVDATSLPAWFAFHKPAGVLTTRSDPHGGATIYDVLPPELAQLKYLGRLDRETEGLLLLSNQGDVIHELLHPSRQVEREYRAWVVGIPTPSTVRRLTDGVVLGDGPARAKAAGVVGREGTRGILSLVLTEGRKREVRRLLEAVGHPVLRLLRVRFGTMELGDLPQGAWRPLTDEEISRLTGLTSGG
ncbi:MAG: pseudouridine synthase [Gemmatimonadota bacterium]